MKLLTELRKQSSIFGIATIYERICSFFLILYFLHHIQLTEYAIWTQIVAVLGLVSPIILLSLPTMLVKFLPEYEKDPEIRMSIIETTLTLVCISLLIFFIVFALGAKPVSYLMFASTELVNFVFAYIIFVFGEVLCELLIAYFRAKSLIRNISVLVAAKSTFRLLTFICLISVFEINFYNSFLAYSTIQLILILFLFNRHLSMFSHIKISKLKNSIMFDPILKFIKPLIPMVLLTFFCNFSDRFLILHILSLKDLALYSSVFSISAIGALAYTVIGFNFYPLLSQKWNSTTPNEKRQIFTSGLNLYFYLIVPFLFGLAVLGPSLLAVISNQKLNSNPALFVILGLNIAFFGIYQFFWFIILLNNQGYKGLLHLIISITVNISLNLVLIPSLKLYGAAVSSLVSVIILLALTIRAANINGVFSKQGLDFVGIFSKSLIMAIAVYLVNNSLPFSSEITLVVGILVGVIVYFTQDISKFLIRMKRDGRI